MSRAPLFKSLPQVRLIVLAIVAMGACTDAVLAPPSVPSELAGAKGGRQGPTVKSTDPDSATVDTTLSVRVLGSGFDQGSRADWAFKGVVSDKIVTNSTVFVSSSELVANITIARNANIGSHDVIVTTSTGKPGIGTELFEVTLKTTDLGTLGGAFSYAYNINSSGDITGHGEAADGSLQAAYWTRVAGSAWTIRQLSTPTGAIHSNAGKIDDAGMVYGSVTYSTHQESVRWTSSAATAETFAPFGPEAHVTVMNDAGQAVGWMPVDGVNHAFLWENGVANDLGGFSGGDCRALSINGTGVIVGYARPTPYFESMRAVVWRMRVMAELPSLPGGTTSQAKKINADGVIVGENLNAASEWRAVRWVPAPAEPSGYRIEDLGIPSSFGQAINTTGEIVGYYRAKDGLKHAFYWHPTRGRMNLPPLPRQKGAQAYGINDAGEVVGYGWTGTGQSVAYHGIVWTGIR